MADPEVVELLENVVSLLKIGFASQIRNVRETIAGDTVSNAILEELEGGWRASGDLQRRVAAAMKVSKRTVRQRLGDLVALGAVRSRGKAAATEYSLSGLI
jgi:DNA-binding HxlR family transcriptional regulator